MEIAGAIDLDHGIGEQADIPCDLGPGREAVCLLAGDLFLGPRP
jgi:hypothetical protein